MISLVMTTMFTGSMIYLLKIIIQASVADNCHTALTDLIVQLGNRKVEVLDDSVEVALIENTIKKIEMAGPFTGGGFFVVSMTTVTSMIGYTVTYLIVLIQFKTAEHSK